MAVRCRGNHEHHDRLPTQGHAAVRHRQNPERRAAGAGRELRPVQARRRGAQSQSRSSLSATRFAADERRRYPWTSRLRKSTTPSGMRLRASRATAGESGSTRANRRGGCIACARSSAGCCSRSCFSRRSSRSTASPLMMLNVLERRFVLLGMLFRPQDFYLVVLIGLTCLVTVVLSTVVFGRIWCGWLCPQTDLHGDALPQGRLPHRRLSGAAAQTRPRSVVARQDVAARGQAPHLLRLVLRHRQRVPRLDYWRAGPQAIVMDSPARHVVGLAAIVIFSFVFYLVFRPLPRAGVRARLPIRTHALGPDRRAHHYHHLRLAARGAAQPAASGARAKRLATASTVTSASRCVQLESTSATAFSWSASTAPRASMRAIASWLAWAARWGSYASRLITPSRLLAREATYPLGGARRPVLRVEDGADAEDRTERAGGGLHRCLADACRQRRRTPRRAPRSRRPDPAAAGHALHDDHRWGHRELLYRAGPESHQPHPRIHDRGREARWRDDLRAWASSAMSRPTAWRKAASCCGSGPGDLAGANTPVQFAVRADDGVVQTIDSSFVGPAERQ